MKDSTLLILTPDFPDETDTYVGSIFVKDQIDIIKKFFKKIIVICPVLYSFKILSSDKLCKDYKYDNVEVYYPRCIFIPNAIPYLSHANKMYFDSRYYAIKTCIKEHNLKFDLIHSHFTYPSSYYASLLKEQYSVPYIMTINEDSGWLREEIKSENEYMIRAWMDATRIITINNTDNELLYEFNPQRYVIPYSVNNRYYIRNKNECRQQLNLPINSKILFTFGIFQKRKGFEYLIEAMRIVTNVRHDVYCYIGGKSEIEKLYERYIRELVTSYKLENYVHFTGFLNKNDIPLWLNSCDLYVSSSLEEGLGITQIEALSCGKPVIATNTNGSIDIITSPDIGLLCTKNNAYHLADKILLGLDKQWDSDKIIKYANKYHPGIVSKKLYDIYEEVLSI